MAVHRYDTKTEVGEVPWSSGTCLILLDPGGKESTR